MNKTLNEPSVVHVSASQVDTFRRCPRLWAFQKLAGFRSPPSKSQSIGTAIHSLMEAYAKHGTLPAEDELINEARGTQLALPVVRAAADFVPTPGADLLVEHPFELPTYQGGPKFVGFMDLVNPRGPERLVVSDYKTCSSFTYCKTPEQLLENTQMMAYAYAGYRLPELPTFHKDTIVQHIYISTVHKLGRAQLREVEVPEEHAENAWSGIVTDVRSMMVYRDAEPYHETPDIEVRAALVLSVVPATKNPSRDCNMYGGCEFRDRCPEATGLQGLFAQDPISALLNGNTNGSIGEQMTTSMEDLKARLQARMNGGSTAAPTTTIPASAEPVAPKPAEPARTDPAAQAQEIVNGAVKALDAVVGSADPRETIVPPDSPPRTNTGNEPELQTEAAPTTDAEPKKPRRSRSKTSPVAAAGPATTSAEATPTTITPTEPAPSPRPAKRGARVLFLVGRPLVTIGYPDLAAPDGAAWEAWMAALLKNLHAELKTLDYRLVEFGKGRGALRAYIDKHLGSAPDVCVVNQAHPEASEFLAVALGQADLVVG